MRELKFRAWDKKTNKMASWELILKECNRFSFLILPSWNFMQFIGRKDKKGKEIYEGDVVKGRYVDDLNGERFENDEITELDPESPCRGYWEDCEIIGNIYENPELKNLSGGKNNEKKDKPQPV